MQTTIIKITRDLLKKEKYYIKYNFKENENINL